MTKEDKLMLQEWAQKADNILSSSNLPRVSDFMECYKMAMDVFVYFLSDISEEEEKFWDGVYNYVCNLEGDINEPKLCRDCRTSIIGLGTYVFNIPSVRNVKNDLPNANFEDLAYGNKDFELQLRAFVQSNVLARDLAAMFCDFHNQNVGPNTPYEMWLEIYNDASENLRLPLFGSTCFDLYKMTADELKFCIYVYKDKVLEMSDPERRIKWQNCIDAMSYEFHLRFFEDAGEVPQLMKAILYKNFPPKKPSAKEISRQKQEEVSFKMETLMTLTMKMLKAEKDPSKRRVFTDALKRMFDDYYQQCLEFDKPSRATMFCRNLQISANLIV